MKFFLWLKGSPGRSEGSACLSSPTPRRIWGGLLLREGVQAIQHPTGPSGSVSHHCPWGATPSVYLSFLTCKMKPAGPGLWFSMLFLLQESDLWPAGVGPRSTSSASLPGLADPRSIGLCGFPKGPPGSTLTLSGLSLLRSGSPTQPVAPAHRTPTSTGSGRTWPSL
jgi:hypothetical protein